MLGGEKNTKKDNTTFGIVLRDSNPTISYSKTNKLITALYMVTDIMDKEEPLRNKLRMLGNDVLSDTYMIQQNHTGYVAPVNALPRISEIMSFLDIAGAVNLISEMNANILRKEFFELKQAIEESIQVPPPSYSEVDLSKLFKDDFSLPSTSTPTRLGVQRGSTLLKALKKVSMPTHSEGGSDTRPTKGRQSFGQGKIVSNRKVRKNSASFEVIKGQRQKDILAIIKASSNGATVTDIKANATGLLASCGDKTLQRELVGMLKNGVLKKTGEKRWSRYFIS